ncbi:SIR2 family protein [Cryobacterium sp. Hh11]|uniref:SIR2 family protein n=1 Tax=Cryobacterium sp. Hh11 TaxID=2555868 RepID=UPI00106B9983|nr:SIR2 family protein [Cryobacterium sp. Hh11]TFD54267.1 SIR2 family protein [Cryobacterium sp. Hh11]
MATLDSRLALTDIALVKTISLFKGSHNLSNDPDRTEIEKLAAVRRDVADVMNAKNLAFLFGSGCSSSRDENGTEVGIPTMQPLARDFLSATDGKFRVTKTDRARLKSALGLDLDDPKFANNLEALMEVLYGYQFALRTSKRSALQNILSTVEKVIGLVKGYVLDRCTNGPFTRHDRTVLDTYQQFYRRLVQRDRALARPWVFTLNYDLFNETAMDRLGIPYINGFMGSVERRFNPAVFRYSLSQQLDISSRKWSSVDSLVYFAKLHGSVSWESREDGLFPVVETSPELIQKEHLLIYPTPAKQNASFAAPYSDMFREFQTRVARDQSVLITVGYSFSDEHVNNIIFQALTIPTFRLVAFVDPDANTMITKLRALNDPRIWIIGTEEPKAVWQGHFFANFVDEFMSAEGPDASDEAVERVLSRLLARPTVPEAANE